MIQKVIILMGPTGAGKSALALDLAKQHRGEIINADSRQVYVGMDIGTDKIASRSMPNDQFPMTNDVRDRTGNWKLEIGNSRDEPLLVEGVPHYLIDVLTPDQRYSAAEFRDDARRIIADIHRRGRLPIVVGGTGFYVRVLTGHRELPNVPSDPTFRAWAERQPHEALVAELRARSPDLLAKVDDLRNRRRVTRALEISRSLDNRQPVSGIRQPVCQFPNPKCRTPSAARQLKLALLPAPDVLKERLTSRVDAMLAAGLVEETRRLGAQYGPSAPGLQSPGYRQLLPLLRGETALPEARAAIIRAHGNVARRQRSWIRREPDVKVVEDAPRAVDAVEQFLFP